MKAVHDMGMGGLWESVLRRRLREFQARMADTAVEGLRSRTGSPARAAGGGGQDKLVLVPAKALRASHVKAAVLAQDDSEVGWAIHPIHKFACPMV